jgi:hypothetical protein
MAPITLIECIESCSEKRTMRRIRYSRGFENEAKEINYNYNKIQLERVEDIGGKTIIVNYYDTK